MDSNSSTNETGDFECNICFEIAHNPIVTLCGHLYCWPCLYKWLHYHSHSQECPVCKALVEVNKLVPLYGRGKSSTDPRSRLLPGGVENIPNRPSGQRPVTAPAPGQDQNYFSNLGLGFLGGFMPIGSGRFGNMTLLPSLMSFQFNGFSNSRMYGGPAHGFAYAYPGPGPGHGGHGHGLHFGHGHGHWHWRHHVHRPAGQGHDALLKNLVLFFGFLLLLIFIWS